MKKLKRIFMILIISSILIFSNNTLADVGNFESYDSSGGGSSSDWGSSSSNWDSDPDSDEYPFYIGSIIYDIMKYTVMVEVIIVIVIMSVTDKKIEKVKQAKKEKEKRTPYLRNQQRSKTTLEKIKTIDQHFNEEQFLNFARNVFIQLQNSWTERNWEPIEKIETKRLYEMHKKQVKHYIDRKQINKVEILNINYAELMSFKQNETRDILRVAVNASVLDYVIDEKTGNVLRGNKNNRIINTYKLIFIRKKGTITEIGTNANMHNWMLGGFEKIRNRNNK